MAPGEEGCAGGYLTIDLAALVANWRLMAARAAPAECAAVVKADAYGLGIEPVVGALSEAGARTFFVALFDEAKRVCAVAPQAVVYVLNGLPKGAADLFVQHGIRPVLGSPEEVAEWAAEANAFPAAVHVDTGMNRLGLAPAEALAFAQARPFVPALLISHLACADEPDHPLNARQLADFRALAARLPHVPASIANSAATLLGGDYRFDLCRPGIGLYGSNPIPGGPNEMRAVVKLDARVVQVRHARAGERVGYGAAQSLSRDTRLAILSLGYADGIIRAGGSRDGRPGARVMMGNTPCPIIGRISMDLIAVDATDADAARGSLATVIGPDFGVDDLAAAAGTIGYEILTSLGRRYRRTYLA